MPKKNPQFAELLRDAVAYIAFNEKRPRKVIYDELGYDMQRLGGSAVEYWAYRDQAPAHLDDLEALTRLLVQRGGLRDVEETRAFLKHGGHPHPQELLRALFPPATQALAEDDPLDDQMPFLVGPPILQPRRFFGRSADLQRLFDALRGRTLQHTVITGLPRSGKTSMLHCLSKICSAPASSLRRGQLTPAVPRGHIQHWVFIDFQDPRVQTPAGFFESVLHQLGITAAGPLTLPHYTDILCGQLQHNTVILMDEIQVAMHNPAFELPFWSALRALGGSLMDGRLGYVISSQKKANYLTLADGEQSPFLNIFGHHLALAPFSDEEARELIATSPIPFSAADVDWMLNISQRWPAPLQALCLVRWRSLLQGGGSDWKDEALQNMKPYGHLIGAP